MNNLVGARIHITGIVQGVGFRPFVYSLALQYDLKGWVKNTSAGVEIEVDGSPDQVQSFIRDLRELPPPLAKIDTLSAAERQPDGFLKFEIVHSEAIEGAFQPISPDVCICLDCLEEMLDPADRRYLYPFTNCTNCGPRFTIITDIPYDRPNTTMVDFPLCPDCAAEYADPLNRRFHAQPVACPVCGPRVWLESKTEQGDFRLLSKDRDAITMLQKLLRRGNIVAIKGLGGFHLACDAANSAAVDELRRRKLRVDKPFALMMANLDVARTYCLVSPEEEELLRSPAHPIVILERKPGGNIAGQVSPGQDTLGVMLPYTPLHHLLFANLPDSEEPAAQALVMTSGNLSEEPIVSDNDIARERLAVLADAFLLHDRPIHIRCDDSVYRLFSANRQAYPLRRARGYAPSPIRLSWEAKSILATGAELKNTFCLTNGDYAFLSHHIGDMENYETLQSFESGVVHFERLFRVQPEAIAYDLHPNYLATRYALERSEREKLPSLVIQHHHAHIASLMAETGLSSEDRVIGVAFDGSGYGPDGAIWGGEFMIAGYAGFQRAAHLEYFPLPGGDAATRKPARIALAHLWQAGIDWDPLLPPVKALCAEEQHAIRQQLERKINSPLTSSIGRLFDAAAALAGVRQQVNYEAQAAIEFEALVDPQETGLYSYALRRAEIPPESNEFASLRIDVKPLILALVEDVYYQVKISSIAARFHNTLAMIVRDVCLSIAAETNLRTVALSGGVWQNSTLLTNTYQLLKNEEFNVLVHRQVPTNDGGLSLGQAAIAAYYYR